MSATARVPAFPVALEVDVGSADGFRVGNKPAALPPGLSVGPTAGMAGRPETDSGVVPCSGGAAVAVAAAMMATRAAATGSRVRWAALPVAVRTTEVTVDAPAGTVTSAWSWRLADFASIAPRSQEAVPSWLPQPKLNRADSAAGVAASLRVASGTFPPVVQALMVHRAAAPRRLVDCERATATQSWILAFVGGVADAVADDPSVAVGDEEALAPDPALLWVGCACGESLADADADAVSVGELAAGVGPGQGFGVVVGFDVDVELDVGFGVDVAELCRAGLG